LSSPNLQQEISRESGDLLYEPCNEFIPLSIAFQKKSVPIQTAPLINTSIFFDLPFFDLAFPMPRSYNIFSLSWTMCQLPGFYAGFLCYGVSSTAI